MNPLIDIERVMYTSISVIS